MSGGEKTLEQSRKKLKKLRTTKEDATEDMSELDEEDE
jgi:hypothetical protein